METPVINKNRMTSQGTASTLSVTHNFLLEICATPPRVAALRLSIPTKGVPAPFS